MIVGLVVILLVAWLVGWLVVSAAWPGPGPARAASVMRGALAAGLGLGLCSTAFAVAIDVWRPSRLAVLLADLALLVVALWMWSRRPARAPAADRAPAARWEWIDWILGASILLSALLAVTITTVRTIAFPHGDWDGWVIWNMKARFMTRGGDTWRAGLVYPTPAPDYPLLVPGAVARAWIYLKQETPLAPAAIAAIYTAATVVLTSSVVSLQRGRRLGFVAAILLLGSPYLISFGTSQCADVPVGFFMLAALALLATADHPGWIPRRGALLLAGLALGLGTWSKNEGILYLLCVVGAHGLVTVARRGLWATVVEVATLGVGASPLLAVLAHHRAVAPLGWTLRRLTQSTLPTRVMDPARYRTIGAGFLHFGAELGGWSISVLFLLALCALAWRLGIQREDRASAGRTALALGFAVSGVFLVYVTASSEDLAWQIPTSLPRLLIQLWPSAVLLFALGVRVPVVPGDARLPAPPAPAAG